ncbi:MAG: ABC transporter ATP-binding protein [Acidimicrobiia bacterium]|nr:ABC transporter ATP-binding protein [Acidimicrobiia bacterium]MDH5236335.1 ABC transporter ATP-binding protein [Acidimicrobiia bacterium]
MTTPTAVALAGITKRFDDVTAVDAIDLDIDDGEFFALLGPSGCGKTTTLRMIAGLDFPTEGSLKIFGDEVGTLPPNKRPVNTVFQSYALFPHMTVSENVAFGLKMQKTPKGAVAQLVGDAIGLVHLDGMEKRKPTQLSGGQQQRVALARALVNSPKVLLLDEPLGALDLKLRQAMQLELKALQREVGITFVFVTHDQEEALTMSDRIGVMHEGRLLQVGSPENIYERPANRFVADFIGQTNLLEGTVEDETTVCLTNGVRIPAASSFAPGTAVAVSLRPERAQLDTLGQAPAGRPSVNGRLEQVTYLGNALVQSVALDWMRVDVRTENQPGTAGPSVGDQVTVSWEPDAVAVVGD